MALKYKKFYLVGCMAILAGFVFFVGVSSVFAADKLQKQASSQLSSIFSPFTSFIENAVKNLDFGRVFATAPDPDICGNDSGGNTCSGSSPAPATISWTGAPYQGIYYCASIDNNVYLVFDHYVLTVSGKGSYNTGGASYSVSGLANNTTYTWSVEAYFKDVGQCPSLSGTVPSTDLIGWTDARPFGSFTTANCAPPPPPPSCPAAPSFNANPLSIRPGQNSTLSWGNAANATNCSVEPGAGSTAVSCSGGSKVVSPANTTTYTFTANGASGSPCTTSATVTVNVCTDTAWFPGTNTICLNESFVQTSNCGNTRNSTGTNPNSPPCGCVETYWSPPEFDVCSGQTFTQTGANCGSTRSAVGTRDCGAGGSCTNLNFAGGSVFPSSVSPGGSYAITCDYGRANIDAVGTLEGSGSCAYTGFSGTAAVFSCTAGQTSGTFENYCAITNYPSGSNFCSRIDQINNLTVAPQRVVGVCGSTLGTCTAGTASNVSGSTWTCNGSNGGTNASCSTASANCYKCNSNYTCEGTTQCFYGLPRYSDLSSCQAACTYTPPPPGQYQYEADFLGKLRSGGNYSHSVSGQPPVLADFLPSDVRTNSYNSQVTDYKVAFRLYCDEPTHLPADGSYFNDTNYGRNQQTDITKIERILDSVSANDTQIYEKFQCDYLGCSDKRWTQLPVFTSGACDSAYQSTGSYFPAMITLFGSRDGSRGEAYAVNRVSLTANLAAVSDFTLNNSGSVYTTLLKNTQGDSNAATITVLPISGFSSVVNLDVQSVVPEAGSPSLPAGSTFNLSRTNLNSGQYASGSQFSVHVGSSGLSTPGTYRYVITLRGRGGSPELTRTTTLYLNLIIQQPGWVEF